MVYLEKSQIEYLLKILDRQPAWFGRDLVIGKLKDALYFQNKSEGCNHAYGIYKGEMIACKHCDSVFSFYWELSQGHLNPEEGVSVLIGNGKATETDDTKNQATADPDVNLKEYSGKERPISLPLFPTQ